jgi:hypothetical protein
MQNIKDELVQTFAWFEWKLPLFWSTITKHLTWENLDQPAFLGASWALGLLPIEQFHIVVKSMARGRRNFMQSFCNNYSIFDNVQLNWKFWDENEASNDPMVGDLVARRAPREAEKVVVVKGNFCKFVVIFCSCLHSCQYHFLFMPIFMPIPYMHIPCYLSQTIFSIYRGA